MKPSGSAVRVVIGGMTTRLGISTGPIFDGVNSVLVVIDTPTGDPSLPDWANLFDWLSLAGLN
jgi:hypothetical protein